MAGASFDGPQNPNQDQSLSLAIVGGGIAGLVLALSTSAHAPHIPVTLYESAHKFGEIGAGLALGPNAIRALEKISPDALQGFNNVRTGSLDKKDVYFTFLCGQDGKDEEAKQRGVIDQNLILEKKFKEELVQYAGGMVHRAAFLDELIQLVPKSVQVKFGKRLTSVSDEGEAGVVLGFVDGTSARHAAVIGCDGIKSRTRQLLLGEDDPAAHPVFSGKYCYRGLIPMEKAVEAVGREKAANSTVYMGYGGHVLCFPVNKGQTMNVVAFNSADEWTSPEWVVHADRDKMYSDYEGWGETVFKILRLMQQPDIWALFYDLPCNTYYKGNVCVSGDAAHATTPHYGAGAGQAVEDAHLLSMLLTGLTKASDYNALFAAYDEFRRPRSQRLVAESTIAGKLFDFEDPELGDDLDRLRPDMDSKYDWVWEKDPEDDVQAAISRFNELKAR